MAVNNTKDIISVLIAIFGIFVFFSAYTTYQQSKVLDFASIVIGLLCFGIAFYLSGKR